MAKGFLNILKSDHPAQQEDQWEELDRSESVEEKLKNFKSKMQPDEREREEVINTLDPEVFVNQSKQVKICKPKTYENVEAIGKAIKDNKVVILHMEKLDAALATRILEFVYGICYARDIVPENVDSKIILIDPSHKR